MAELKDFEQNARKEFIFRTAEEGEVTVVRVFYKEGGFNYYTRLNDARGVWVGIETLTRTRAMPGSTFFMESINAPGSERCFFALDRSKKSIKDTRLVAYAIKDIVDEVAGMWLIDQNFAQEKLVTTLNALSNREP